MADRPAEPQPGRARLGVAAIAAIALIGLALALSSRSPTVDPPSAVSAAPTPTKPTDSSREATRADLSEWSLAALRLRREIDRPDRREELARHVLGREVQNGGMDAMDARILVLVASELVESKGGALPKDVDPEVLASRASSAASATGDDVLGAFAELTLSRVLLRRGRYQDAAERLKRSLVAYPSDRTSRAQTLLSLAQIHVYQGALDLALRRAREIDAALESSADPDLPRLRCMAAALNGSIHLAMGLPDRAAKDVAAEVRLAAESADRRLIAAATVHRAELLLATQRYQPLVDLASDAMERDDILAAPDLHATLLLYLAIGEASSGRTAADHNADATRHLQQALKLDALAPPGRQKALLWLAELSMRARRYDDARAQLAEARALPIRDADEAGGSFTDDALLAALSARLAMDGGDEAADLDAELTALRRAVDRFLDGWSRTPADAGEVAFLHYTTRRVIVSELLRLTMRVDEGARGVERAFDELHRFQAMGSRARRAGYRPARLSELRRRLIRGDRHGMLVYLPGPDRGHLFLVDGDTLDYHRTPGLGVIEQHRHDLAKSRRAGRRADDSLLALRDGLLPLAARQRIERWSAVTLVATDLIGEVPFEELWVGEDRTRTLGRTHALSYLASLPLGWLIDDRREARRDQGAAELTLLAAPAMHDAVASTYHLAEIPFDSTARLRLTSPFSSTVVRAGPEATPSALDGAGRAGRVLHLLTHGIYDPGRERGAGLVLAPEDDDDGLVFHDRIEGIDAPDLVILSVCGAAKGPSRRGDGDTQGLGAAFLAAGARAVVLSAESLEYEAVLDLMERFHHHIAVDVSPSEALRRARVELAEAGHGHPHHDRLRVVGLGHVGAR